MVNSAESFQKTETNVPVGIFRRYFGFLADVMVVVVALIGVSASLLLTDQVSSEGSENLVTNPVIIAVIFVLYSAYFYSRYSETPGEVLFQSSTRDARSNGSLSFRQAISYAVLRWLSGWFLIGYLVALSSAERKTFHDRIANVSAVHIGYTEMNSRRKKWRVFSGVCIFVFFILAIVFSEETLPEEQMGAIAVNAVPNGTETSNLFSNEALFENYHEAVLEVQDLEGNTSGSGVVFYQDDELAVMVTNAHVINDMVSPVVVDESGSMHRVIDRSVTDESCDITVVFISGFNHTTIDLKLEDPVIGEPIVTIGNPEGLTNSFSSGVVSGLRSDGQCDYIQFTAPISHGSSGGALIDQRGNLLGITTILSVGDTQNLNLAVSSRHILQLLKTVAE